MKYLPIFVVILGTFLLAPVLAQATAVTFTGGAGTTDWNTAGNWSSGQVPSSTDDVTIPSGKTVTNKTGAGLGGGAINSLTLLGTLTIDTASLVLQSTTATSTINNLTLTSASQYSVLTMNGPTTFTGNLVLSPGQVNGSGAATITGPVTASNGSSLGPASVDNQGTITVTPGSSQVTLGNVSFTNDTTGSIALEGDGIIIRGNGPFTNLGSITKSMGTGTTTFSPGSPFTNGTGATVTAGSGTLLLLIVGTSTGTFNADSGATLQFGNVVTLNAGTTFGGSGTIDITAGGVWDVEAPITVGTTNLAFDGATGTVMKGNSNVTINSTTVTWNSGVIESNLGDTTITLEKGVTMNIVTSGYHGLSLVNLDLLGTVNMSADLQLGVSNITIKAKAKFNILTDNGIHGSSGSSNIYNFGTFTKAGGTDISTLDYTGTFNILPKDSHPVTVVSGTLNFAVSGGGTLGGTWTMNLDSAVEFKVGNYTLPAGSKFSGHGGLLLLPGANWTLTGSVSVSAGVFFYMNGPISGAFDLTLLSDVISLVGGARTGEIQNGEPVGTIKIPTDSLVTVYGTLTLDACTLDNSSEHFVITQQGSVVVQDSAVLLNEKTGEIYLGSSAPNAILLTSGTFSNLGLVYVNGGTQTIGGVVPWANHGGLAVPTGSTLNIPAGYVNTGSTTIQGGFIYLGAPMQFEGGTLDGTGSVTGSAGIDDTGGTLEAGSPTRTGILDLDVPLTQETGSAITALINGTKPGTQYDVINSTSSIAFGGTLNLQFGKNFTPTPEEGFNLVNYSSYTDNFTTVNAPAGFTANLNFTSTGLNVTFTSEKNISIQPKAATVKVDGMRRFTGTASAGNGVKWSVAESTGGTVTQTGLYTAPGTPGIYHVVVTSVADKTKSDTATVTVTARVAHTLMAASNPTATAQQPSDIRQVQGVLTGSRVAVYDTKSACQLIDIPDAPARAFRDYQGTVHLISSGTVLWQNVGPTLETVKHSCEVGYWSRHDPNPADWNDNTWLDSFYSIDGTNVVALGHMEYHGWEHPGECSEQGNYSASCWYNGDTFHLSHDGGYHFHSFTPPANYILSVPYQYVVNGGPEGYSIDTNIVKAGDWYYAMVTGWGWPANCFFQESDCLVYGGAAPIRTSDITDPTSWRGWNGQDFSVTFADPYPGPVADPFAHIFYPIQTIAYVNAINFHPASNLFVATLIDPYNNFYGPPGFYLSTSPDLINWSQPTLVVTIAELLAKEPPGNWTYGYFSLLDPDSSDANFSTITDTPYLYYVRSDANDCCYVRVLYRQRIKLNWSQENPAQ